MSQSIKQHYYLCHATYIDNKAGHGLRADINLNFNRPTSLINKSFLKNFTEQIRTETQLKYPEMEISDVRINSISYLGYMTDEEFNA